MRKGENNMNMSLRSVAVFAFIFAGIIANAARIDVYPQSFDKGGWGLDT